MTKVSQFTKQELVAYCKKLEINTKDKTKKELLGEVQEYIKNEIKQAKKQGVAEKLLIQKIEDLAEIYASNLKVKINAWKKEMLKDDKSHYLIYRVLGISSEEGRLIDEYQNTGRFLYKYAGSFLEEAASLCLIFNNLVGGKVQVKNTQGQKPKTFEIDFLDGNKAIEIKWRDATTDGDHITKEHTRVQAIKSHGYIPIRVMFYYPQREQAKKIQATLATIYQGVEGEYYGGESAWTFIKEYTDFDLKKILIKIANKRIPKDGN